MLDDAFRIKIADFGTAKVVGDPDAAPGVPDQRANSFVGTAEYVSPELLTEKKAFKRSAYQKTTAYAACG